MSIAKSRAAAAVATVCLAGATAFAVPAFAQSGGHDFVTVKSTHGYSQTVSALQSDIKSNGLMVLGQVNQGRVMSMTGMSLQAHSFFVGNPRVGKMLFEKTPAAAAAVPARITVWARHGTAYVSYFEPSVLMKDIKPGLAKPGRMLDMKFKKIAHEAAR